MFITNSLIDSMFESTLDGLLGKGSSHSFIESTDSGKKIYIELPGVKKQDIKITTNGNLLTVSADRKGPMKGTFQKSYSLASNLAIDEVVADYTDGLLTLSVPLLSKRAEKLIQVN